jgi:hypothetical protein
MRIFKIKRQGIVYKVYEALQDFSGLITGWKLVGSSFYEWHADNWIKLQGRHFNPQTDRVMKTWDGYGRYMKSNYNY